MSLPFVWLLPNLIWSLNWFLLVMVFCFNDLCDGYWIMDVFSRWNRLKWDTKKFGGKINFKSFGEKHNLKSEVGHCTGDEDRIRHLISQKPKSLLNRNSWTPPPHINQHNITFLLNNISKIITFILTKILEI